MMVMSMSVKGMSRCVARCDCPNHYMPMQTAWIKMQLLINLLAIARSWRWELLTRLERCWFVVGHGVELTVVDAALSILSDMDTETLGPWLLVTPSLLCFGCVALSVKNWRRAKYSTDSNMGSTWTSGGTTHAHFISLACRLPPAMATAAAASL